MTQTLFGGPIFLCRMLLVRQLDAKFLFEQTSLITVAIKYAWEYLAVVISDGNGVSQSTATGLQIKWLQVRIPLLSLKLQSVRWQTK